MTRRFPALAVLAVLLGTFAGVASAHGPNPSLGGAAWPDNAELTFRWRAGSVPNGDIQAAIKAAATDNNDSKASKAARFVYHAGGVGLVGYGANATCGVNGIGCFTRTAPDGGFTMWLREHGRVFDWGRLRWCQMEANPANGCYDAETIALDEFGHIQGLDHHVNHADGSDYKDAVVQAVSRTRPKDGWNQHVYGRCDVATLQKRYDVVNTSADISTCLDLDTVLTVVASPTSIPYGGTTRLTATLKVGDASGAGRLRGNPLSNRTVKLQRRAPGATTWTTVAPMPAGTTSGTYTLTQKLQTAAEFRATFATPGDEGINGDSSPTVTVAVGSCTGSGCPQLAPTNREE